MYHLRANSGGDESMAELVVCINNISLETRSDFYTINCQSIVFLSLTIDNLSSNDVHSLNASSAC